MIAGIVLAAGASTRMGRPKALANAGNDSFLIRCVRTLWTACDGVTVVLGSRAPIVRRRAELEFERLVSEGRMHAELTPSRRRTSRTLEAQFVTNRKWQEGMLSSVREGLRAARGNDGGESVLVLPVDHPDVRPETIRALAALMSEAMAACRTKRERAAFSYALIPRSGGHRGHPVALSPALADAIARDRQAVDLSDAVKRNARLIGYLDVKDTGILRNRNTPRD
jgi:CTP:molybdopterin cytidylyltransferase MocA